MALHINEFKRTELGEKREFVQQQKDLCFLISKASQEFQLCYFRKQRTVAPAKNVQQAIVFSTCQKQTLLEVRFTDASGLVNNSSTIS